MGWRQPCSRADNVVTRQHEAIGLGGSKGGGMAAVGKRQSAQRRRPCAHLGHSRDGDGSPSPSPSPGLTLALALALALALTLTLTRQHVSSLGKSATATALLSGPEGAEKVQRAAPSKWAG